MFQESVFTLPNGSATPSQPSGRGGSAWRTLPLEGAFALHYRDVAGRPSRRRIVARELKVGPGKILLGGIDEPTDAYRGFRADRIDRLVDQATGEIVERNVVDWLLRRADQQERRRRRAAR
jgi:hypothetical protein